MLIPQDRLCKSHKQCKRCLCFSVLQQFFVLFDFATVAVYSVCNSWMCFILNLQLTMPLCTSTCVHACDTFSGGGKSGSPERRCVIQTLSWTITAAVGMLLSLMDPPWNKSLRWCYLLQMSLSFSCQSSAVTVRNLSWHATDHTTQQKFTHTFNWQPPVLTSLNSLNHKYWTIKS